MRRITLAICLLAAAIVATETKVFSTQPEQENAASQQGVAMQDIQITRAGSNPSVSLSAEYFTGIARLDPLVDAKEPSRVSIASVTFEPGARTHWHTHPVGQHLYIMAGLGWVQQEGGDIQIVRPGDVVWFPPNVKHWHGAAPKTAMTHLAILESDEGHRVDWMGEVTDAEYTATDTDTQNEATTAPTEKVALTDADEQEGPSRAQQLMGDIAPRLANLTDDVLYGQVWAGPELSQRDRSLATVSALIAMNRPDQLRSHLRLGLTNGLTEKELVGAITHLAFYSGWPNSVTAVGIAREVFERERASLRSSQGNGDNNPQEMDAAVNLNLVYEGAITENVAGAVNVHPVTYNLGGIDIAANVYTPANYRPGNQYPAVVVAHPNGGVKEQVAGLYAQRLAEQGYITITADAAYQGASGGLPRNVDWPANRIEDIRGMADFISQYAGVDEDRVGLLGICGGGGYALKAAQTDKRFQSIATLSMFNTGLVRRNGFHDSQVETIQLRLQQASDARAQEAAGGEVIYAADATLTDEQIAELPFELYREGYEYYGNTHAHPNSTFRYTMSSLLHLMNFDAASNMDLIDQPLLMMSGNRSDTLYMTEAAFPLATNAENKELYLIEGATHIETYWKPAYVDQAMEKLTGFFSETLK